MRHMFFSRDVGAGAGVVPARLAGLLECYGRKNIVSHVTFASSGSRWARGAVYGRRPMPRNRFHPALAPFTLVKNGKGCRHYRFNTSPEGANVGKYLVFYSSNMIRAGKYTHADSMLSTVRFCRWIRSATGVPYQWHTAMGAPNTVIAGRLRGGLPPRVRSHWRATHTTKFPGIAIAADGPCTPELYE